jgi:hypothetical protein
MASKQRTYSRRIALRTIAGAAGLGPVLAAYAQTNGERGTLRAGAHGIDISPERLPVIVNGGFLERRASEVVEPLHARCLVLDDGTTRIAIAVVDNIAMRRAMLDSVKKQVQATTGIRTGHMLISATHTHSAPSVWGVLGSGCDETYARFLPPLIAEGIERAAANLEPARVGWAVIQDQEHTHCRRWIRRPDRMNTDPFGVRNVRAHMHPAHQDPNCIGPSGPDDPDITMLSVQARDGRPIAVLANYSMHYYGAKPVSTDYYGPFCTALTRRIGAEDCSPEFVAMMSHGTSGDQFWRDYRKPQYTHGDCTQYAELVAARAAEAYGAIVYRDDATIQMAEKTLTFDRRVPDAERLAWAKGVLAEMGDRIPQNQPEVYAREAVFLHEDPTCELILQAIRIGGMGITAVPNEVYALTGLKLKARSPLQPTMNIELANGAEGYIPPPEQYVLGGYNTWPARSAGLEVGAEPRIVEAVLELLEAVSGKPARKVIVPEGPYAKTVYDARPAAYWRLNEMQGPRAVDGSGQDRHGQYEDGVAFYLSGPDGTGFRGQVDPHRATHFAGGRMRASLPNLGNTYSVALWFWNGLPADARLVTGYCFSRGPDGDRECPGDHLGLGGTYGHQGKLIFFNGNGHDECLGGSTTVPLRTWNHVVLVRDGTRVTVYLNGNPTPEIAGRATVSLTDGIPHLFIGGRCDNFSNWEGKAAEVAVYDRALTAADAARHYAAAGVPSDAAARGET